MAHNVAAIQALLDTLQMQFDPCPTVAKSRELSAVGRRTLIFATSGDKDVLGMLHALLPHFDRAIFTVFIDNPRAMPVEKMMDIYARLDILGDSGHQIRCETAANPNTAWEMAASQLATNDLLCVTGSTFLVAEVRPLVRKWLQESRGN